MRICLPDHRVEECFDGALRPPNRRGYQAPGDLRITLTHYADCGGKVDRAGQTVDRIPGECATTDGSHGPRFQPLSGMFLVSSQQSTRTPGLGVRRKSLILYLDRFFQSFSVAVENHQLFRDFTKIKCETGFGSNSHRR